MQKRGYHDFSFKLFLSHSTEKFRWGTLRWIRNFRVAKVFMHKKGISLNSVEKFLSHSADEILRRTLLCFERIQVSKIFKQRGGKLLGFVDFFLSHRTEKLRQVTILCFRKFLVGKKFLWVRGGEVSRFSLENFLSHCIKMFHWRTLWCFRIFFSRNFSCIGRGASRFCRNFLSHRTETKTFVKQPFCFPENFWYRKKNYG